MCQRICNRPTTEETHEAARKTSHQKRRTQISRNPTPACHLYRPTTGTTTTTYWFQAGILNSHAILELTAWCYFSLFYLIYLSYTTHLFVMFCRDWKGDRDCLVHHLRRASVTWNISNPSVTLMLNLWLFVRYAAKNSPCETRAIGNNIISRMRQEEISHISVRTVRNPSYEVTNWESTS